MTAPTLNFTAVDLAIAKLDLAPADILVVKIDAVIDNAMRQRIAEHVGTVLGDGGKVLVLDRTADVSVVRLVDDEPRDADDEESGG